MSSRVHSNQQENNGDSQGLGRPERDDKAFDVNVFPNTDVGRLLDGFVVSFLIKQEPRLGWARKRACSETVLLKHPCEVVASHQWGLGWLIMSLASTSLFREEMPANFDISIALQMALIHDEAELKTGDITPVDGISADEKHERESKAMELILGRYPREAAERLHQIYSRYEDRNCIESKFVKDCDRLDFMITAFMLERQGFSGFYEFYVNSSKEFHTKLAKELAKQLIETRDQLAASGKLCPK